MALVVGSIAPDLAYALSGTALTFNSHALLAQLWWSVPVAVIVSALMRSVIAPSLAPGLPDLAPFHLRDFGAIGNRRHRVIVSAACAFLGALTHVGLDGFTHPEVWAVRLLPVLRDVVAMRFSVPRCRKCPSSPLLDAEDSYLFGIAIPQHDLHRGPRDLVDLFLALRPREVEQPGAVADRQRLSKIAA